MSFKIERIIAREILDSRGNPTVEVEVTSVDGSVAGHQFLPVPAQVPVRRLSFVTATSNVLAAKGF